MEKFIIKKIEADFDERWLRVKKIDDGKGLEIFNRNLKKYEVIKENK